MTDRFLTIRQVCDLTGLSRTTIWRLEKSGAFPPRRRVSSHRVGWLESEVLEWMAGRPSAII